MNLSSDMNLSDDQDYDLKVLIYTSIVANALALAGTCFNFFTGYYLKTYLLTIGKMVLHLSLADLVFNLSGLISLGFSPSKFLCNYVLSATTIYGLLSSLLWTLAFAHALYMIVSSDDSSVIDKYYKTYVVLTQGISIVFGLIGGILQFQQVDEGSCYHPVKPHEFDWTYNSLAITPGIITIVGSLACYIVIIRQHKASMGEYRAELLLYPIVTVLCQLPAMIDNYLDSIDKDSLALSAIANALFNMQGFFNALIYGLSSTVINGYRKRCSRRQNVRRSQITKSMVGDYLMEEDSDTSY